MKIITPKTRKYARLPGILCFAIALLFSATTMAQDNADAGSDKTADADARQGDGEQSNAQKTNSEATGELQADGEEGEGVEGELVDGEQGEESAAPSLRRGNRMEFDARLIRGESAGSGAVFLFQRAQRPLPSMIDKRSSFLRDTVDTLLGDSWAEKFDEAQSQNAHTD